LLNLPEPCAYQYPSSLNLSAAVSRPKLSTSEASLEGCKLGAAKDLNTWRSNDDIDQCTRLHTPVTDVQ